MKAKVRRIALPRDRRAVCVSDIHGHLDLFRRLLGKVGYADGDMLILLGDLYTKGPKGRETLRYIIELSRRPDVFVLRGNCDWEEDGLGEAERAWLADLPHILASEDYLFVHGGLSSEDLDAQDALSCMKNDNFMEQGLRFSKYVVAGHWPAVNYTHRIPCCNPIVDRDNHIISIDGGNVIKEIGQLNAFVIQDDRFGFDYVDDLPLTRVEKSQPEGGGTLNTTWNDRFIEIARSGAELSLVRHLGSGKTLLLPNRYMWEDGGGRLCGRDGTDYFLPVRAGDTVSVVDTFADRMLAKKDGTVGWVWL